MVKALIIIDMIKGNMKNLYNAKEIINNQLQLIQQFNKRSYPVIIVTGHKRSSSNPVMLRLWGKEFVGKPHLKELIPKIKNTRKNKIIQKEAYSAFFKTDLEKYCKQNKIKELYFCGVYSGVCVYFSAVDAAYRHIQPYLVSDASSTENKVWHKENSRRFQRVIGPLITTKQLLKEMSK